MSKRHINRRKFIKTAGLIAFSGSLLHAKEKNARPNFIIFVADDLGWNDVGAYGHPHIRTPNIDRLAKEGVKFTDAFLTCASCSPTRCSVMTGRYPHSTGAMELHQPLPAEQVVFAGNLKKAGYYTAAAGKWHLGNAAKVNFDSILGGGGPSGGENWVKALRQRPKDKPFFMWMAAFDPHRGYAANTIPVPHKPADVVVPPYLPDNAETRKDLAMYYDEVTRMDGFIGKVLEELDTQKITDNTFVLFISDNGRPFPRCKTTVYDSGIKTPLVIRWPNKVKPNTVCNNLVSTIDIAPTVVELAGAKSSSTFQGRSFAKMLTNPKARTRDYIFAEHNWHDYQAHDRAVRSKEFLYIRNTYTDLTASPPADAVRSITYRKMIELNADGKLNDNQMQCFVTPRPAEELYDVKRDPYSLRNLVIDQKHKSTLNRMRNILDKWIKETNDKIPKNPTPDTFDRITGDKLK